jgi:transcription antitermination factor NusG
MELFPRNLMTFEAPFAAEQDGASTGGNCGYQVSVTARTSSRPMVPSVSGAETESGTGRRNPGLEEYPRWYALCTCSRHEKQVARHLEDRAVEHFLPLYLTVSRWKDRQVQIKLPLFPGYIFVRIAFCDRMKVLTVPSAVALISAAGRAIPIPDEEITGIQAGLRCGMTIEPHPYLKVGRRVRIRKGPFAGFEGVLARKGATRVVISFDLLKQGMAVEIDALDVVGE